MKKLTHLILLISLLIPITYHLQPMTYTYAAVPHLINYQGRLTDKDAKPLEGAYNLNFRIYDAENAGNLLWQETHSGVVIQKGIFNILLGSVTSLNLPFDKPYFLEIKVGDEVMSPRQTITSAGYAIRAEDAEKLGGQDPSNYRNASNINAGILSITQGGTGRGSKLSVAQAVGTTDITAPNTENDMPNMTVTLNTYGTKLLVMFSAPFGNAYSTDSPIGILKINIDGTNKRTMKFRSFQYYHGDPINVAFQHLETGLTPSNHIVKIRWYRANGADLYQRGSSDSERILSVIDLD